MSEIRFRPFKQQKEFLKCQSRIKGAFAGKRSGKTECGAIQSIMYQEQKLNYDPNGIDPYIGLILAPTFSMLQRLSLAKFMAYAKPFIKDFNKSTSTITWHDGSIVYGLSADKPERIEGIKAHWCWADEIFQMTEQLYLEMRARTADTQGNIICTGSLGVNIINPKMSWVYDYFKSMPDENTKCFEWRTIDNPYFPKEEIESLKDSLDPQTFKAMFEINWDSTPKTAVYSDFTEDNVMDSYTYNPMLPTYISIDWGWAHEMACLYFQHDPKTDTVYLFDEIVKSKMTLEQLFTQMTAKPYEVEALCCDIAGNQEREQTGRSNIRWFEEKGIFFKKRRTAITYGIPIVRSYIKNMKGQRKFFIASNCKKSIDGMKQYRYKDKDGIIQNENPIKENDDCMDALRYYFVNFMDKSVGNSMPRLQKIR